jgi:hypothetical protein
MRATSSLRLDRVTHRFEELVTAEFGPGGRLPV